MAMKKKKISKVTIGQAQEALTLLFPPCKFVVAPNGLPGLWVKDEHGYGFAVSFGAGKAGVSCTVRKFVGSSPPVTVTGNAHDGAYIPQLDATEVSLCVYRTEEVKEA